MLISIKGSMSFLASLTSVRRLAMLAAASAILLWGSIEIGDMIRASARYQKMAAYCEKAESTYLGYRDQYRKELRDFEAGRLPRGSLPFLALSPPGREKVFAEQGATLNREAADSWRHLKHVYANASRFPWVGVPEGLEHPHWEGELDRRGDGEY